MSLSLYYQVASLNLSSSLSDNLVAPSGNISSRLVLARNLNEIFSVSDSILTTVVPFKPGNVTIINSFSENLITFSSVNYIVAGRKTVNSSLSETFVFGDSILSGRSSYVSLLDDLSDQSGNVIGTDGSGNILGTDPSSINIGLEIFTVSQTLQTNQFLNRLFSDGITLVDALAGNKSGTTSLQENFTTSSFLASTILKAFNLNESLVFDGTVSYYVIPIVYITGYTLFSTVDSLVEKMPTTFALVIDPLNANSGANFTVNISDGGLNGTFDGIPLVLGLENTSNTFTYTPSTTQPVTFTFTNSAGLIDSLPSTYSVIVTPILSTLQENLTVSDSLQLILITKNPNIPGTFTIQGFILPDLGIEYENILTVIREPQVANGYKRTLG